MNITTNITLFKDQTSYVQEKKANVKYVGTYGDQIYFALVDNKGSQIPFKKTGGLIMEDTINEEAKEYVRSLFEEEIFLEERPTTRFNSWSVLYKGLKPQNI